MGKVSANIDDRYRTLKELRMAYEARSLRTGAALGVADLTLPGTDPKARALAGEVDRSGQWRLGVYAQPYPVTLERELRFVTLRAVLALLQQAGDTIKGRQVAIAPTRTEAFRDLEADDFLRGFNEEWRSFAKKANPWLGGDPREKALDMGPVTIMGTTFTTLRDARDRLRVLQRRAKLSLSARLSEEMTELLHEEFLRQAGSDVKVSLSATDRRGIEDFIARESRIYEETGSIDPESIAHLRTKGAEFLVVSRFRAEGVAYTLKTYMLNMQTGERVSSVVEDTLDPRLTAEVNRRF
jgi:hypothetical protein